jgi:hypothetical protein
MMASTAPTNLGRRLPLAVAGAAVLTALTVATAAAVVPPVPAAAARPGEGWGQLSPVRPLGGVMRPRRVVRFARLIQWRIRASRLGGRRRLRRQSDPGLAATQGDQALTAASTVRLPASRKARWPLVAMPPVAGRA